MTMTARRHLGPLAAGILTLAIGAQANAADAAPDHDQAGDSQAIGAWRFVRTAHPQGGQDAVSIMHTADTSRSDLDLAGLMVRCAPGGPEALVVLIRPFSLRARPQVKIGKAGEEAQFEATVAPPGTAILLPKSVAALASGPWQSLSELFIEIADDQTSIHGVLELAGLKPAFELLRANCPSQ